jgi:hypothetical protein
MRFICGSSFHTAPHSLQRKYIRFGLKRRVVEPNLLSYLFYPVYQRLVGDLGIAEDDCERKEAVLDELLSLMVFDAQRAWVIAHKSRHFKSTLKRAFPKQGGTCPEDLASDMGKDAEAKKRATQRERQIQDDYLYALMGSAICKDDTDKFSTLLLEEGVDLNRDSLCFGNSILRFALSHGSMDIVRRMIGQIPHHFPSRDYQYETLYLAAQRADNALEAATFLLAPSMNTRILLQQQQKNTLKQFLPKACREGHLAVVRVLLGWIDQNWNPTNTYTGPWSQTPQDEANKLWINDIQGKKSLFKSAFNEALQSGHRSIIDLLCPYVDVEQWQAQIDLFYYALHAPNASVDILHTLLKLGAKIPQHMQYYWNMPLLCMAASKGCLEWVDELLNCGADPRHYSGSESHFVLLESCREEDSQHIRSLLMKHGWALDCLEVKAAISNP